MATEQRHFGAWDYVVFALMLLVSAGIGIFYGCRGGKQRTTKEFLMANRSMSVMPVAVSILLSFVSAIMVLGTPAEMYTRGTEYFLYVCGICCAIVISTLVFVPLLYPLRLTSSYEYLERRFRSRAAKVTGSLLLIVHQILYMGLASFAPSTALEAVTGFPVWATIVIVGLVSTFYTTLGGMKAVVWTDVFQGAVLLAGLVAVVVKGLVAIGGFGAMWTINDNWGRIQFFDFSPDPTQRHSFWSLVVGGAVTWTAIYGCNQASVQRFSALPTLTGARQAMLLNAPGIFVLMVITCMAGLVIFAFYVQHGCDPLTSGRVDNPNQIVPYFVMEVLNVPGLPGLFVSCLFSGALSSVSSSLNALSAVTWEDFLKPVLGDRLSEAQKTWVTKLLVLMYGGCGVGVAFLVKGLGGTVLQASLSFTGAASGPSLGMFLLGGLFPCANAAGAVSGGILGLILPIWISIGAYTLPPLPLPLPFPTSRCLGDNVTDVTMTTGATTLATFHTTLDTEREISGINLLYTVSYLWYPSIGTATVVVVGLIVSLITGPMKLDDTDPKYLIPIFDRLLCCLPARWLKFLRCNKEFPKTKVMAETEVTAQDSATISTINGVQPTDTAHQDGRAVTVPGQSMRMSPDSGRGSDISSDTQGQNACYTIPISAPQA